MYRVYKIILETPDSKVLTFESADEFELYRKEHTSENYIRGCFIEKWNPGQKFPDSTEVLYMNFPTKELENVSM